MASLVTKKEIYIIDDCWDIIKEFAGICDYGINWKKLEKVGVEKAHNFYKMHCKRRISNYKSNPKKVKQMIYKSIFTNHKTEHIMKALAVLSNPVRAVREVGAAVWWAREMRDINVGDEVIYVDNKRDWRRKGENVLGVVTKVHKTCISWKEYELSGEIDEVPRAYEFLCLSYILLYDKTKFKKVKVIKSFKKPRDEELLGYKIYGHSRY